MGKNDKRDPEAVEVLNPRYAGATPGMVAKALMRPVREAGEDGDGDKQGEATQPALAQSST